MATQNIKPGCKFCPPQKEFANIAKNVHAVAIICDNAKSWGHSMIIPFEHSSNLASGMKEEIWKKGIIPLLRKVIEKFRKNPQVIGFHINSNAGGSAEQTVFHTHIHLVPLYKENQGELSSFLTKNFTSQGAKKFSIKQEYSDVINHINECISKGVLNKNVKGTVEAFNLSAYIKGDNWEDFWIIPKTSDSNYHWGGGVNCKCYNFQEREKIAERIKNEQREEESAEKPNIPKKEKPTEEPIKKNDNQQLNQNGNSDSNSSEPEKDKNKKPTNPSNKDGNENDQRPNGQDGENNENDNKDKKPNNVNGSDNKPDREKNKLASVIPNSVKQYFKKNNVQKIELDGENWIIAYKGKKESRIVPMANIPEIQDLKNYLQSQGMSFLDNSKLETNPNSNSSSSKLNENKYWPWILGIGGILMIGIIVWAVRKKTKKSITI